MLLGLSLNYFISKCKVHAHSLTVPDENCYCKRCNCQFLKNKTHKDRLCSDLKCFVRNFTVEKASHNFSYTIISQRVKSYPVHLIASDLATCIHKFVLGMRKFFLLCTMARFTNASVTMISSGDDTLFSRSNRYCF